MICSSFIEKLRQSCGVDSLQTEAYCRTIIRLGGRPKEMANCYIFNPANGLLRVTLNGVDVGAIPPANASVNYQPQSIVRPTVYEDRPAKGRLSIARRNTLSIFYPDDPKKEYGPYTVTICTPNRVSVDDDIVIFAARALTDDAGSVVTMTSRGFTLDTTCSPAASQP